MATPLGKTDLAFARLWHLVDARGQVLGHLSRGICGTLQGLHKPIYDPSNDCGDYVVVVNARHIQVSGEKALWKMYRSHSGYPGGLKEVPYSRMMEQKPTEIIRHAVYGMLPKNKLRKDRMNRLLIFPDEEHPYRENIARFYEQPEFQEITAREWANLSASELLEQHHQRQQAKLKELLRDI